ncbi:Acetyltransferase component of pyruvate dehydrogenase complex [Rhodovastum atsumiense]|nr:Acetyltransferase component of pyruvate dehydrogenase complex [Rhodovastum atsumiense]
MLAINEIKVPDIGDFKNVPIIEVHVQPGAQVNVDDPLVTLESDKATMDVPSTMSGTVEAVLIKAGDRVSEGSPIVRLRGEDAPGEAPVTPPPSVIDLQEPAPRPAAPPPAPQPGAPTALTPASVQPQAQVERDFTGVHASPSVRRLARELGVDLAQLRGSGEKGRVTAEDVKAFLRGPADAPGAAPAAAGTGIPEIPAVDFAKFGPIETVPLSRIKRLSGPHLHRSWLNVPHVTHGDEADITEIDAYRKELDAAGKEKGYRVTLLAFLLKASAAALRAFPEVNASLGPDKASLILKRYTHIGVAVDTPEGLVVPVIRDVDRKGIIELSQDLGTTSKKAREGKLSAADMQGGCFTISSLGGIGGTTFTPIVNAPEVAILGVVRSRMAPVWDGTAFLPRLMLPLFVSYDHRVIDGALAARFARHLCNSLEDVRRLVL